MSANEQQVERKEERDWLHAMEQRKETERVVACWFT